MIVRPTISGTAVRVRIENAVGQSPVVIADAWIGQVQSGAALVPGTNTQLTFNGTAGLAIAPGEGAYSDPVAIAVTAFQTYAVSLDVTSATDISAHALGLVTNYLATGSHAGDASGAAFSAVPNGDTGSPKGPGFPVYWVTALDVQSATAAGTVVAFGDSITDGECSTRTANGGITGTVVPEPTLTPGTAANGVTYLPGGLVPGSWAQVKGANLATANRTWAASDFAGLGNNLPSSLSGTSLTVNGLAAAISYVSPGQINFQVPAGVSGNAAVQVTVHGMVSNSVTSAVASSAPGIVPIPWNGVNYAGGVFLDQKIVGDPSIGSLFRKAKAGDVIQLFGTGFATSPAGTQVSVQPISGVTVTLGTVTIPADAAALVEPGEFQVNFTVPAQFATLPESNYPLTVTVNGVSSPASIDSAPPGPLVVPTQH